MDYINIKVYPDNIDIKAKRGCKLIDILYKNDKHIDAICGLEGKCGKCRVKLLKGKVSFLNDNKAKFSNNQNINSNIILACQSYVNEDIEIELFTNTNSILKGEVNKKNIKVNPIISKKFIKLSLPTLEDCVSDEERIIREVEEEVEIETFLLLNLYDLLNESNYEVTLTIFDGKIINIEKGDTTNHNYAIAIDLGTTTIAGYLINLNDGKIITSYSTLNLQKDYGADVISRINYAIKEKMNRFELKKLAIKSIDNVICTLLKDSKLNKKDISILGVIGNTTMSHLLIGMDIKGISKSPFTPVFTNIIKCNVGFLEISSLYEQTKSIVLPNIGGYVGSDTLGVIIGTDLVDYSGNCLAIDIGTNCELVLKTNERILACSTAAGPAFEGANMKHGIIAQNGAICGCDIKDDFELKIIGNNEIRGICGSGYIDIIGKMLDKGMIKKQGRIVDASNLDEKINEKIKSRIKREGNANKVELSNQNEDSISIYQEDISNLQLAKGAVKSGIEIMMENANVEKLDKIYLAGSFGSSLDKNSLKSLKMIPNVENHKIEVVGNAAATGLIDILLSKDVYNKLSIISSKIEHIELASDKQFEKKFIKNMMF